MPIITLTTDLGTKDNYLSLVKAYILKSLPGATSIDISNEIEKYNIQQAAYIFGNAYHHFPVGTIHLLAIKSSGNESGKSLFISLNGQYILCPDNGLFSLFHDGTDASVYLLDQIKFPSSTFYVRDTLTKAALDFIGHNNIGNIAKEYPEYLQALTFQPTNSGDSVVGKCIYIDSYGNVITNIKKDFFESARKDRRFTIHLPSTKITEISDNYDDVVATEALALFNSAGHLEIAINRGAARQLLFPRNMNTHTDFNITIEFD